MTLPIPTRSKPAVYVAAAQHEGLRALAERSTGQGAELLRHELDRAVVVSQDESPRRFVQLGSVIEYEDLLSGRARTIQLVAPQDADIDENRISVVSPVGAAVLGLVPGEAFSWVNEDGRPRLLV